MIPFLLAIVFTVGVVVAYDGLTRSDGPAPRERRKWRRVDQAEAFLRQAGVEGVRVRDFLVVCAAAGIFLGLAAQFVLGWPLVSLVAAALGSVVPLAYLAPRRERRRAQVQVALVDLAAQLRAAIQAGYSVQEGLSQLAQGDRNVLGHLDDEQVQTLSQADARRILAATDGSVHYALYALDLSLGLRLGELTGLRWSDVDLDQRLLHVRSQLQRGQIVPLKRTWHRRTLMLSPWLVEVLEAHADLLADVRQLAGQKWRENDLLFPSDVGTPAGG